MFLNSTSEPLMPALTFPALTVAAAMLLTGNLPCQPWPRATAAAAHGPSRSSRSQPPGPRPVNMSPTSQQLPAPAGPCLRQGRQPVYDSCSQLLRAASITVALRINRKVNTVKRILPSTVSLWGLTLLPCKPHCQSAGTCHGPAPLRFSATALCRTYSARKLRLTAAQACAGQTLN